MRIEKTAENTLQFYCPGCKVCHEVTTSWEFNDDFEKPTLSPSILVTGTKLPDPIPVSEDGKYKIAPDGSIEGTVDTRCHSFGTNGKIQFLGDCTHELKDQTVELPNL